MRIANTTRCLPLAFITILSLLTACASQDAGKERADKDEWLQQAYSQPASQDKASRLIELPKSTRFREAILTGQIQRGMHLDEALATLRAKPYGTLERVTAFWCETVPVQECAVQCISCEAFLFGQHQIVKMEGYGLQITVTDYYPKRFADFRARIDPSVQRFAQAIYERKFVPGMPAGVVQMLINQESYPVEYFCDDEPKPTLESCLGRCDHCRVEVTPRSDAERRKILRLETHAGQQTISEILER